MTVRFLTLPAVMGLCLVAVGCSGLDRTPAPVTTSSVVQNSSSSPTHRHLSAQRASVIRPATFDEPAKHSSGDSPDLSPVSTSHFSASETLQSRTIQEEFTPPVVAEVDAAESATIDLDLTSALAMTVGQNPRIAFAAARYREAYARLEAARTLWLPSIRAGATFYHHDGTLQASEGEVFDVSRSSLQAGLGTRAIGAGAPTVPGIAADFHTADAYFQPQIATHTVSARDAATEATTNDTLLATTLAYLNLLRAMQELRIAEETRNHAEQLADLTATFARTGQGPQADADRTRTELVHRRNATSRAQENTSVARARLAEMLSLDPSIQVFPREPTIVPIELVSDELPVVELIATGLANRPELAEARSLVCEAVYRYRREKYAPLLPSVLLGVSQGGFGGGLGSNIDNDHGRFDFDATAYWELRNFGLGEQAKRDETRARYQQTRALQASLMDRVAREVVEAHAQSRSRKGRIQLAESGVEAATDSFTRNLARIRNGQGLPIEVLQSLQALDEARREYLRTLVDYNDAQFRLHRALGWPLQ